MDQFDLLAVQGILKSLLQHHSSKSKILRCPAFSIVQISHPCMTTGKTIALTRQTFIGKVMCLFFNMLSRLVITFLPRSKHHLISWLHSPSTDFEAPQNKICVTVSTLPPSISHEVYKGSIFFHIFTNIYCHLSFWLCGSQQTGKFLNRWEHQTTLHVSWETYILDKKEWLEMDMEQWSASKLEKEYIKAVYCHPAYLTYIQSTPCEILDLMKHKLVSRMLVETSTVSYMQMITL